MGGQRSIFRGPMVLHLGGQWSGANSLGGQSSIYPGVLVTLPRLFPVPQARLVSSERLEL